MSGLGQAVISKHAVGEAVMREEAVLRLAVQRLCGVARFVRGRLFLHDADTGQFHVRAVHDSRPAHDVGGPAVPARQTVDSTDPLVELLTSGQRPCVLGADRPGRDGGRCRPEATRLAVPLPGPGPGLLGFVVLEDDGGRPVEDRLIDQVAACADLVGAAALGWRMNRRLATAHEELSRQHHVLRFGAEAERRLGRLVGRSGGLSAIVRTCSELTGKSVALFDSQERLVASAGPMDQVRVQPVAEILAGAPGLRASESSEPIVVPARPAEGLARRHVLTPVVSDGRHFGWLVIMEYPSRLTPLDEFVARRAGEHTATEFTVQKRVAAVAWNARASLARQLVRGTYNLDDLRSSGEYLGIDTDARRVLVYLTEPGTRYRDCTDNERLASEVQSRLGVEVLTTRGSEGTVLLVESPAGVSPVAVAGRVKSAVREACAGLPGHDCLTVGLSSVSEPSGLARAYREAREVANCINRFAKGRSPRILAVDDLGPARLFLANSDTDSLCRYVDDVLGPLLTGAPHTADLLLTLQYYFDSGRSVRISAAELGVHENTIRLRLARVHAATGLDVSGDANDQLSVQTALLVLRLQGHPALPSFDETETDDNRRKTA
ncbi:PucR family transcriptional regulator [Streptomyces sp. NPDC058424]|uniref:PucR family transcriptional regulator n=1 Tax=Streptomyces sp. NPDC058424 TaxID=3346491 RepID=UPI003650B362